MGFQHACFAGLNQWFHRRRALAISILAAVASLGGLALIPTMNLLIDKAGLRWGLIASGGFYAVILLPLCYWFRNRPEDMGLLPDGATRPPPARPGSAAARRETRDYTVREALRTQAYWLLLVGAGLRQMATLGILISLFPILVDDKGMSTQMAANLLGAMSAINFVSRLAMGYMGDRGIQETIMFPEPDGGRDRIPVPLDGRLADGGGHHADRSVHRVRGHDGRGRRNRLGRAW